MNSHSNRLPDGRGEVATHPSPDEGSRLEDAMRRADDLLVESLRHDEQLKRRKRRWLIAGVTGGVIMVAITTFIVIALLGVSPQPQSSAPDIPQPQKAAALEQKGWSDWQAGKLDEAIAKFSDAVKLDPKLTNAWNGLGWAEFNSGDLDAAEKAFRKALELEPNHPAALNGLGQIDLERKNYARAEQELLKAAPNAPAACFGLARLYLLEGKFAEAQKWAQKAVDAPGGESARPLLEAAKSGKLDEALRKQLEPKTPTSPDVRRGWQLLNRGSADAKAAFEAAIRKNPNDPDAHNGLGWYYLNNGRLDDAKKEFETALKLQPDAAGAMNGLARVLYNQGRIDEAIKLWEKMTTEYPGVNAGTFGLAQAYLQRKEYAKALKYYQQLAEAMPDNPEVQKGLKEARMHASQ